MVSSLISPDFSQAPIVSFNMGGNHIYIPIPEECNQDTKCSESNISLLNDDSIYDVRDPSFLLIKHLIKSKFRYFDSHDGLEVGQIRVEFDLLKVDHHRPVSCNNLFLAKDFIDFNFAMLKQEEKETIKTVNNLDKTKKYLVFPQSISDIKALSFGGISWLFALFGYTEVTRASRSFITPITNNHVLSVMVSISGFDFGSVELEQELVAEADQYILDFIKSIRIDYSPETLAEIQHVRGDVTA
tara:strand:- start:131 stop:859 length:729 start_codon:yes stop_codon:yes gene_type:complete